ncbi:MAG: hypothetical protein WCG27_02310 [Pseudomonadota bacterium]
MTREVVETPEVAAETPGAKTIRNFRNAPDIEAFYRFVNNNDLRREAKLILEVVLGKVQSVKKKKKAKAKAAAAAAH